MAAFLETGIDLSRIEDLPYMRRYIMLLNEDLRYMFNNIDPEDNFTEEGLKDYRELDDLTAEVGKTIDLLGTEFKDAQSDIKSGFLQMSNSISLYVVSGNVTNQINMSNEIIDIDASRLHIISDNLTINDDVFRAVGEIEATGGQIGAFSLEKDSSGKEYLKGGTGSKISSGTVYGAEGDFGTLTCNNGEVYMGNQMWYMWNCRIKSDGLEFTGGIEVGDLDIAKYDAENDVYTAWYSLTSRGTMETGDIHVGRNWDDSGQVRCYSIYSYFEGAEKPDPYGEDFSDRRIKRNIRELNGRQAIDFLSLNKPVSYRLFDDDRTQLGVIAQDVLEAQDAVGEDFGLVSRCEGYYTVNYVRYIPIIAAALSELRKEIEECQSMRAG